MDSHKIIIHDQDSHSERTSAKKPFVPPSLTLYNLNKIILSGDPQIPNENNGGFLS